MSRRITGQVQKNLLESAMETGHIWDKNRTIQFANPDTPVLTGMRIKWNSGKI
jgi:hypothetical protein